MKKFIVMVLSLLVLLTSNFALAQNSTSTLFSVNIHNPKDSAELKILVYDDSRQDCITIDKFTLYPEHKAVIYIMPGQYTIIIYDSILKRWVTPITFKVNKNEVDANGEINIYYNKHNDESLDPALDTPSGVNI